MSYSRKTIGDCRGEVQRRTLLNPCEITNEQVQIQIFSNSSRGSLEDRASVHDTVRKSLGVSTPKHLVQQRCILITELLVGTVTSLRKSVADSKHLKKYLNTLGRSCQLPFAPIRPEIEVGSGLPRVTLPTEFFKSPMVAEVIGAGFD